MASRRLGLRAFQVLSVGSVVAATAPIAFAQEGSKKPNVYDDDESSSEAIVPYPGTATPAHEHKEDESQQNKKSENSLKSGIVNGVRVRTSEVLEKNMNIARHWLIAQSEFAKEKVDQAFERYLHTEKSVTKTIAGLKSDKEEVLPGGIYVLVSTLTGSIVARNRGVFVRSLSPLIFGLGAFAYFLPKTFDNTRALTWEYEQKVPELAKAHVNAQQQFEKLTKDARSAAGQADKSLENGVRKTREFIEETTGLQIGEGSNNKKK